MWRVQAAILCLIWSLTFFSVVRYSDAEEEEVVIKPNPLLDVTSLPPFSTIEPAHVVPAITTLAEAFQSEFIEYEKQLEANRNEPRTWESVEEALEKITFPVLHCWKVVSHLSDVKDSPELQKAKSTMQSTIDKIKSQTAQSLPIYNAFKELKEQNPGLDEAQHRILDTYIRTARLGGAELTEEAKTELNRINLELSTSYTQFGQNLQASTKEFNMVITEKEKVKGIARFLLKLLANNAVKGTGERANPKHGPWKVILDRAYVEPLMKHSQDRKLREDLYRAFFKRACSGDHDNRKVFEQIRKNRQSKATILGYKNFPEFSLASKMVKKVEDVWEYLNSLHIKSHPVALSELQNLTEYAQSKGHEGPLENWDVAFWKERQYEELYSLKESETRPYFPVDRVVSGLFKLCSDLFGIKIQEAVADVWHKDARFFKVYDENEIHLASFYMDLYKRSSEKPVGSAFVDHIFTKSSLLNTIPVAVLICYLNPPVGSTPSLMSFGEVKELFHEFGHALHHMLTTIEYAGASGLNNIEWDAMEIASQVMENWIYDWDTISAISGHYETNNTLPSDMFQHFFRAKKFFGGHSMERQLYIAALDMEFHESADSWQDVATRIGDKYSVPKPLADDCYLASFMHIFTGESYAAGIYTYKWGELLAQDEFEEFSKVGLQNREEIKSVGKRFRETVLSLGGGVHPMEVFKKFTGRDPSSAPLLHKYGL